MDRDVKGLGLVLKKREAGERDVVLTIFSPSLSLLEAREYGTRKGGKGPKVPLYAEGTFSLYSRGDGKGYSLKDVDILSLHEEILSSYELTTYAALVSEMTIRGKDYSPEVYSLVSASLDRMSAYPDPRRVLIYFLVHYLDIFGTLGDFSSCPICHRMYASDEVAYFNFSERIATCKACSDRDGMLLPPSARAFLKRTLEVGIDKGLSFGLSDVMRDRILSYLLRTLSLSWPGRLEVLEGGFFDDWL